MKKIILFILFATVLNGCAEYSALLGPGVTMATTGSVARATGSLAASYTIDKSELMDKSSELRECKIIHSAELNEIFFTTLDELDCKRNDFSILR